MNKQDLIRKMAEANDCSLAEATNNLEVVTQCITDALVDGDDVQLFGFGKFAVNHKESYIGRNPSTGASIRIAAKNHVKFVPAKGLKDSINA